MTLSEWLASIEGKRLVSSFGKPNTILLHIQDTPVPIEYAAVVERAINEYLGQKGLGFISRSLYEPYDARLIYRLDARLAQFEASRSYEQTLGEVIKRCFAEYYLTSPESPAHVLPS